MGNARFLDSLQASGEPDDPYCNTAPIVDAAKKSIDASKIGKVEYNNPLANWSAEVVEIDASPVRPNKVVSLRKRTVDVMHNNSRKEDTVASIKVVSEKVNFNTEINDNFRNYFSRGAQSTQGGQDLNKTVLFESTNLILQAIGETDTEKYQIIDSFGKPQIFMFGRRYRIYSYSGMLWNNKCNNWKDEFKFIYNKYLRGTECINYGVKIMLTYDRSVRMGYLLSMTVNQVADVDMAVPVNFSMFIEDEKELVDEGLLDPGESNVSQDVFALLRQQQASVKSAMSDRERAINKKLEFSKNSPDKKIVAPSPPPKPMYTQTQTDYMKLHNGKLPGTPQSFSSKVINDPFYEPTATEAALLETTGRSNTEERQAYVREVEATRNSNIESRQAYIRGLQSEYLNIYSLWRKACTGGRMSTPECGRANARLSNMRSLLLAGGIAFPNLRTPS